VWKLEEKVYVEEEIDLRELFKTIWDKRIFILVFTFVVTLISVVYVYFKNPIPIYQGKAYIEIGQIQSQNFGQISLNTAADTVGVLMLEFKVSANILKGTNNILEISSTNEDKNLIKENLEKSIESIINKHKEKSSFYENVIMTKQIGNIIIGKEAINKSKKTLIIVVSFVTGFILAIFVLFLIQFVNTMRKED
jgi:uncharacterized protein involved in exopolysaccharide biosynthesis